MLKDDFLTWIFLSWKLNFHQRNPKVCSLLIIHAMKKYALKSGVGGLIVQFFWALCKTLGLQLTKPLLGLLNSPSHSPRDLPSD